MGDEVVVALTKVLESNGSAQFAGWEKEFQSVTEKGEGASTM